MISSRAGFQKTYDLAERVLPKGMITPPPSNARATCSTNSLHAMD